MTRHTDPAAEVLRCHYCRTLTVGMGSMAQCPKGCPGRFDTVAECRVPRAGVEAALSDVTYYLPEPKERAR